MAIIGTLVSLTGSLYVTPFLMIILCVVFLASIGMTVGVRRLYIQLLIWIFEYGRANIEVANKNKRQISKENRDGKGEAQVSSETSDEKDLSNLDADTLLESCNKKPNGFCNGTMSVIRREDLILVPDPELNYHNNPIQNNDNKTETGEEDEKDTQIENQTKLDFQISTCLDLLKAGVEAIIEDQVTSRFEAEELKNWNLLTRTNRQYEFISWKLTVIWVFGFFVRYFFLFPLRVLICFFGVLWSSTSMPIIALLPQSRLRRWLNVQAYLITSRLIARSLSAVITFHNHEYKPTKSGVCVANHTTPIDTVFLSTENCYSLVMLLTVCTALVGYASEGPFKTALNRYVSMMCFGVLSRALSSVIMYHNAENRPKNGICVANHTSPIDVLVLMCDNCYSLIGQRHGGFLGVLQRALARASPHIWFERSEVKDRNAVANRLKQHVSDPKNPPILIFPEGTCINNTSVMQFKKGSFEVASVIYPVAIKYDPRFGDAFWNSHKYSMMQYLYMMMTSWAIVCDVWYLPPMYQQEGESAIEFANRVKSVIAKQGGLVDLMWDGQLKRSKPKKEWKELQQQEVSKRLKIE